MGPSDSYATSQRAKGMHLATHPFGDKGNLEGCLKSDMLQGTFPNGLIRWKVETRREDQEEVPGRSGTGTWPPAELQS